MEPTGRGEAKWNIFARELESILQSHGYRLGHLNDRSQIHPEKVRRLQRSLQEPRFNLLSPDELEHVSDVFGFTADERLRLRAALLATAVEDMLMNRIEATAALVASDQVFDILLDALQSYGEDEAGLGAVKGEPILESSLSLMSQDAFDEATADVDRAYLTLHLALVDEPAMRNRTIALARTEFAYALTTLQLLNASTIPMDAWTFWRNEAQRGLTLAEAILQRWSSGDQT
jgi:hypothetical protein